MDRFRRPQQHPNFKAAKNIEARQRQFLHLKSKFSYRSSLVDLGSSWIMAKNEWANLH
jgi:hypothetical protein